MFLTARPVYVQRLLGERLHGGDRNAPPGRILALVNGAFSERFARIAIACGRDVDLLEVPWGRTFDLGEIERRLEIGGPYAIVTVVQSVSTGVLTDVRAISDLAHRHRAKQLSSTA